MKKIVAFATAQVSDTISVAAMVRSRWQAGVLVTLGALALSCGVAVSAQASTPKPGHPPGGIKLAASRLKRVGDVLCGDVRGRWIPGSIAGSGYFLSDSQRAQNYRVLARHARGATKRADLARAKLYAQRAERRQPLCIPPASQGATWTPPAPTPLRFDLSGAIGLALSGSTQYAALHRAAQPAGPLHRATPAGIGLHRAGPAAAPDLATPGTSLLEKVSTAGQLSSAVTSGSASISHFLIGPNNNVYVVFSSPVNLANTSQLDWQSGCVLAEVDPSSGVPTCVDTSLSMVNWSTTSESPGIQFDNTGAIYYSGSTKSGQMVLRRFDGSTSTDLITGNVMLNSFTVAPNGTVVISGTSSSTGAAWTRRINPSGSLATLANTSAMWTSVFPDGNVYLGTNAGGWPVVARYLVASDQMDPKWWIADSTTSAGANEYLDSHSLCSSVAPGPTNPCVGIDGNMRWLYNSGDGHEYAIGQSGGTVVELFPTLRSLSSEVTTARVAQGVSGSNLAIAGTNANGQNVLTLYNTTNDNERELIGPGNEIEIYHLNYVADGNKLLFDGLRFSDNQYVIGEYDLTTNQVSVVSSSSVKWADLQSFGSA